MKTNFWHMQMFPGEKAEFCRRVPQILEHHKFIGLGKWDERRGQIANFCEEMKVGDIVAIKNGAQLIALVQIIGGMYEVRNDESDLGWIVYRRPIRVLDWEIEKRNLPQPRGTLNKCTNEDADTTKVIVQWYEKVEKSFLERNINLSY